MQELSPFHAGEQCVQSLVGVRETIESDGSAMIRNYMPDQHIKFYLSQGALPTLFASTIDEFGRPWASILIGDSFVNSPNSKKLEIRTRLIDDDPLNKNLKKDAYIGLLGIEFATRRRNRMNGKIELMDNGFAVNVDQSFGNCPKYIQARRWSWKKDELTRFLTKPHPKPSIHTEFPEDVLGIIKKADTLFVASAYPNKSSDDLHSKPSSFGCDVSHRGGRPGFVSIHDNKTLSWPDYIGNMMFNTIGNIVKYPKCGLLFMDFEKGDIIQMTGEAKVLFDDKSKPGAQRMVQFKAEQILHFKEIVPVTWHFLNYSPFNPKLEFSASNTSKLNLGVDNLPIMCRKVVQESHNVKSYTFGAGLVLSYEPGQYATFEIDVGENTFTRNWTISSAPEQVNYGITISVKKKSGGFISNLLFDQMAPGVQLRFLGISGEFTLAAAKENRKLLMLAGGIGITPMMSMTRWIAAKPKSTWDVVVIWTVSSPEDLLFQEEIKAFPPNIKFCISISRPSKEWTGITGRISKELIASQAPDFMDRVAYVCGPELFMESVETILHDSNFPAERLITEHFNF